MAYDGVLLLRKWRQQLIDSRVPEETRVQIWGIITEAVLANVDPDTDKLDPLTLLGVNMIYPQATAMKEKYDDRVEAAGNRKDTGKLDKEYPYVLRKLDLSAPQIEAIIGYNANSIRSLEGWKAAAEGASAELKTRYEQREAEIWHKMLDEFPDVLNALKSLNIDVEDVEQRFFNVEQRCSNVEQRVDTTKDNENNWFNNF